MTLESRPPAFSRLWRPLLVAFVLASCVRIWVGPAEVLPQAQAQIPDAGSQRLETQQLARETNRLLAEILVTLKDRTLNVRLASTDNNGAGEAARGRAAPRR